MLWTVTIAIGRTGLPSTPLRRKYAVVADDPGTAQAMVKALLGDLRIVGEPRVDAHQNMIVRVE